MLSPSSSPLMIPRSPPMSSPVSVKHSRRPHAAWKRRLARKKRSALAAFIVIAAVVGGAVVVEFGFRAVGCNIKGNISRSGEPIYHVPGQEYYSVTFINLLKGERWFCSEEAAR